MKRSLLFCFVCCSLASSGFLPGQSDPDVVAQEKWKNGLLPTGTYGGSGATVNLHNGGLTAVHWTEMQYDGIGRVKKVIPPAGSSSASSLVYKYGVIPSGSDRLTVSAAFDAKGVGKAYLYDVLGSLREVRENAAYSDSSSSTGHDL